MTDEIRNTDNVIDSRDVIARIEDLESQREALTADLEEAKEAHAEAKTPTTAANTTAALEALVSWDTLEAEELKNLKALAKDAEDYAPDWEHGAQLINDDYFTEYAEELADDCGMINREAKWPLNHINWEAAAEELKGDYTEVSFDGAKFWVR